MTRTTHYVSEIQLSHDCVRRLATQLGYLLEMTEPDGMLIKQVDSGDAGFFVETWNQAHGWLVAAAHFRGLSIDWRAVRITMQHE